MTGTTLRRPSGTLPALISYMIQLQLRGAVIWGVVLGLYAAAMVASFLSFGDPEQMNRLLDAYPAGILEAFGITDMSTIEGYLSSQVFNLAPLALAFFPVLACAGVIAGAEERGTMDVLLGNPIPRWQIVVGCFASVAVSLLLVALLTGAVMYSAAELTGLDLSLRASLEAVLNLWPICMFFGGLALLCSAVFHRRVFAVAIPGLVLLVMYLLDSAGRVSPDLEDLRPLSVFYYYGSAITDGMDWTHFFGLTAVALIFGGLAVLAFQRRDIYT